MKAGDFIQWDPAGWVHGKRILQACDGTSQPCGVAAHDIDAGETITYDRYRNTRDVLLKGEFQI